MSNTPEDERRIDALRCLAIDAVQRAHSGHAGMPLGAAAMAYALWTRHLRHDPTDPKWPDRDRFILSAGHGSALLYALLYLCGYGLALDDLKAFRQLGSRTPGHPESHITLGVDATTGPLGQGVGSAVGFAIAEAHLAAVYNRGEPIINHRTYVLASNGDLMEGISAEAVSLAGHLKLGKLIMLYDDNHVTLSAPSRVTFTEDVAAHYEACGWHTLTIALEHGNDVATIDAALNFAEQEADRPSLILVRTHVGDGSPRQDSFVAQSEPLGSENVRRTKQQLGWPTDRDFYVPEDVLAWWRANGLRGQTTHELWKKRYAAWKSENPDLAAQFERASAADLPARINWPNFTAENGNLATRDAGGIVMNAIADDLPELVGGSADLAPLTKTYLKGFGDFSSESPAGRNIHFGDREHAMAAIANGIAQHGGLVPFTATFFNFLDYMKPSVRLAALAELRVINVFTHDSVFLGEDGPTHEPIEQLATLRATPNVAVIRPADSVETVEAWRCALASRNQPVALVLSRQRLPFLGSRKAEVARGAYVIYESSPGKMPSLILIATGSEVSLAIDAAKLLAASGTLVRVVSMPCWEYFAAQPGGYRDAVLPPECRARISIEAAATLGWERWIGDRGVAIGIDHFGASAPAPAIAKAFGLTPEHVAQVASRLLARV